jgi:hypothetical protein
MTTYASYYEKLAALPEALRDIALDNWDETGRPLNHVPNPLYNVIVSIIKKNEKEGFEGYRRDMELMFDENPKTQNELVLWYNLFMSGANHIANKMIGQIRAGRETSA